MFCSSSVEMARLVLFRGNLFANRAVFTIPLQTFNYSRLPEIPIYQIISTFGVEYRQHGDNSLRMMDEINTASVKLIKEKQVLRSYNDLRGCDACDK